ncbi:MAG: NAD(P)H-binding protein [Candidatus Contendobacter sp.]|nr:NAD(P)H-binding protein [Candidatus Contendobacter sp.]MDG4559013.1 NAD(P)H-binding protein [Candidatus Contendobacter sp.]
MSTRYVFVTGGTGYIGRPLIRELLVRGHSVRALVRSGSTGKLPAGAEEVVGDALDAASFAVAIPPADTLVHLVGTPHPSPLKARQFREVDLASIRAAVAAVENTTVRHLIYLSVAHPAPVMKAFIAARMEGEALVRASGLAATILRPWYVLGPGHRWPYLLAPLYRVLETLPSKREQARRLGLVTLDQMVAALVWAVENPAEEVRIVGVPEIRN